MSPKFIIGDEEEISLKLIEVINHSGEANLHQLKIMISKDYDGGEISNGNWIELERPQSLKIPSGSWGDLATTLDISEFKNQSVTIMLWMKAEGSETVWEVKKIGFFGQSGNKSGVQIGEHSRPPALPIEKSEEKNGGLGEVTP